MNTKFIIVIDMQNDFVTGSLKNEAAEKIILGIVNKIKNNDYLFKIYTRDTHDVNYLTTQEGKHLPVEHCINGTFGHEIVQDIMNTVDNKSLIVDKKSFGYDGWKETFDFIKAKYGVFPDEVELCGTCTSICVASNATVIKTLYPELKVTIDSSICADVNDESHKAALLVMKMQQCNVI